MAKSKKSKQDTQGQGGGAGEEGRRRRRRPRPPRSSPCSSSEAKKASKAADKAVKAAEKAQAKAVAAGAPAPKAKPTEAELLKLALRSTEAKLTDAERKVEALEQQIADFHRRDAQELEDAVEDAIVDAAVEATVEDAVIDTEIAIDADRDRRRGGRGDRRGARRDHQRGRGRRRRSPPTRARPLRPPRCSRRADAGAEPTVTTAELTPPLPEDPADDEPSESWTLLKLRAEAKQRGLTGTSNLPKAALLERLRAG